jgi:hypothetical protein
MINLRRRRSPQIGDDGLKLPSQLMCFSETVSFSAAAGLSLLGIGTIRQTTSRAQLLLAAFPCLFAVQQTLEGLVWLGKSNSYFGEFDSIGTYGFLLFATLLWLVLSPLSIYLLETDIHKKRLLLGLAAGGLLLGVYLFGWIMSHGIQPQTFSGNLLYDLRFIPFYEASKYLYLAIIVLPFAIAHSSALKLFSGLIASSFALSQLLFHATMVSVWCFFAAVLSGFLYVTISDISVKETLRI